MNLNETEPQIESSMVDNFKTEISNIQSRLVNTIIIATLFFLVSVSIFVLPRFLVINFSPLVIGYICIIISLFFLTLLKNYLSFRIKSLCILLLWLFLGVGGILKWGLIGMGIPWFMALSVWVTIVFGVRNGIGISLLTFCIIVFAGVAGIFQYVFFGFDFNTYSTVYPAWALAIITYGFLTALVTACIQPFSVYLNLLKGVKSQLSDKELENIDTLNRLVNLENEKKSILDVMINTQAVFIDPEMKIIWANTAFKKKFGEDCVGHKCHKIKRELDEPCPDCVAVKSLQSGVFATGEVNRNNGITYQIQCNPVRDQDGELLGIVVANTDVTEQKQLEDDLKKSREKLQSRTVERTSELSSANEALENAVINSNKLATEAVIRNEQLAKEIKKRECIEKSLKSSEERYRSIIESIEEGYFEMNIEGKITFFNNAFCQIGGYTNEETASKFGLDFIVPEQIDEVQLKYADVAKTREHQSEFCYDIFRKNGTRLTVEASISLTYDINDKINGYRGIIRDVDQRKKYEENLIYQAYHDALTGLRNRKAFYEKIEEILQQSRRNNNEIGLAFIDIDKFKEVNDTLGHEAGDDLLKEISSRLVNELRSTDYVFRLGGDEFTIIFSQSENIRLNIILNKIITCLSRPYSLGEIDIDYVSASIGMSVFPKDADDSAGLIKSADTAMYKAKEGRNGFVFFKK